MIDGIWNADKEDWAMTEHPGVCAEKLMELAH